jgi:hypothetical protein
MRFSVVASFRVNTVRPKPSLLYGCRDTLTTRGLPKANLDVCPVPHPKPSGTEGPPNMGEEARSRNSRILTFLSGQKNVLMLSEGGFECFVEILVFDLLVTDPD